MNKLKASRLAASRVRKLCDEEGILPAIEAAMARGEVDGHASPERYLVAVLEGEVPDRIDAFGWQVCQCKPACQRQGRCLRQEHKPRGV